MARFGARDVARLLADAGIVRHRGKIESAINNARRACELRDEVGSLAGLLLALRAGARLAAGAAHLGGAPSDERRRPSPSPSRRTSGKRGWTFVGPTTMYAFMQAVGIVNDHLDGCAFRSRAERARRAFERPR